MTGRNSLLLARDARMAALAADGQSAPQIAAAEGVSTQTVRIWARDAGVRLVRAKKADSVESIDRAQRMATMYRQGLTLEKIGQQFGVTRERVRQLLAKQGITGSDGGAHLGARFKVEMRAKTADAKAILKYGVDRAELAQLRGDRVTHAYGQQKNSAGKRGIDWRLSFAQWLAIWQTSGKLHLRGRGKGKYVMSRIKDDGCYEMGNVHIQLAEDNSREAIQKWNKDKPNRGVFMLYPGTAKPWIAKFNRKFLGTHASEAEAVEARRAYMQSIGKEDAYGLGSGRGYTFNKGGYQMQAAGRRSRHKTAEEARAAYLAAVEQIQAERAEAKAA